MESRRKVALITGANRGVGKGIALAFAEKGYDLFLIMENPRKHRKS